MNWVCDQKIKAHIGITMFYVGSVLGRLMFGYLADRIGRVPVLIYTNMLSFVGNMFTMMTSTGPWFSACRFIAGMAYDNNFVMMFILCEHPALKHPAQQSLTLVNNISNPNSVRVHCAG